ncbi:hypothetical protein I6F21_35245 [Bradyrhizobium sp. NBAIM03]|uniref:hypothetical protein n=1 Tax=Bradyrhizobium sp. NBAIM03 TaxID=2793816 RepID=UPI001CD513F3|nr:hypothetical protein [Bradyrhizobium sp. NBAIM03]MCA1537772.1 hypothetical protein [Bradyrhizobium sp. NBAIM03]
MIAAAREAIKADNADAVLAFFNEHQCPAAFVSQHVSKGALMPAALEFLLWCVALATWLMLLCAVVSERLKRLSKLFSHLREIAFRHRVK